MLLAPGNRADLLVTTRAGTSTLQALPYNRGSATGMSGGTELWVSGARGRASGSVIELATLTGPTAAPVADLSPRPTVPDLRGATVATRRILTLAMGMGMGSSGSAFTIDGRSFDPTRVDQHVPANAVEEWMISNTSQMDHPFHLHVWPMQVLTVGGSTIDPPTWQNVVNIPAHSSSTVRVAFNTYTGRTVYHCHILDHEDNGMMGTIEVA